MKFELENDRVYATICGAEMGSKEDLIKEAILRQRSTERYYKKYYETFKKEDLLVLKDVVIRHLGLLEKIIPGLSDKVGDKETADIEAMYDIINTFNAEDMTIDEGYFEYLR